MHRAILLSKIAKSNLVLSNNSESNKNSKLNEEFNSESNKNSKLNEEFNSDTNIESGDFCTQISKIKRNIINEQKPKTIFNSGPFDYKMVFENKDYPHSVNLTKLHFNYTIGNEPKTKLLFLSTGHSFAESQYKTNTNIIIDKNNQIEQIFTNDNSNIFYSLDNGFDDFCLLSFDSNLNIDPTNYLSFGGKDHLVNSVCRNMDIKFLENEILIKNGHNTGETKTKAIISFESDVYLTSKKNKFTYFTFKINGKIVIISSKFPSGITVRGTTSTISKFNGEPIGETKLNEQLAYYFLNSIKEFRFHELFESVGFESILSNQVKMDELKSFYTKYRDANCLSVVSMMGDSGSGFFRLMPDNNLEFVGINIGGCPMIILSEMTNNNNFNSNQIYWDESLKKLVFGGKYVIEEVHRACQVLPINQIEELINRNLPMNIRVKEINV